MPPKTTPDPIPPPPTPPPRRNPYALERRCTLFTVSLGQHEREHLHFLSDSEGQNQSTIVRRCIDEIHDRVTGVLPLGHTRFNCRFNDLERTTPHD